MGLIDTHNCFALDFRGHGDSSAEGEFSLDSFADDLVAFINYLKIESTVFIVASSLATWIVSSIGDELKAKGVIFLDAGYYLPSLENNNPDVSITLPVFH